MPRNRIPGNSGDTIRNKRGKSRIKSYEYWPTSEVKTITDNLDTAKTQYFHYDDLGRLDSAEGVYGTRTYGYDLLGNRQTLNAPGGSATYQYTSGTNRVERTTGAINKYQSYDANGRVFSLGWLVFPNFYKNDQISFVFIGNNRPIARYSYNYQKQRVEKYTGGLNTFYHYDKDGHLIEETDRYGTPITTYIRLAGEPLAQVNHDGAIYYYHNDHLGTPQLLSDVSGSTAWAADYLPFGDASISVESITNNLRFAGQYYDWETGLHYNWHRFYDPGAGRYLSADPIGLDGGLNLYAYVENDPVNWVDPWGLKITPLGTDTEKALIQSWLATIGDCCDSEVQERLRVLEESANNYRIKFTDNMVRAGQHKNGLTELDSDLKNPNSTTFWYRPPVFTKRPGTPYFQGTDTLAHELLGHGFDEENGYYGKDEATARAIANKVRDCLGKTRRGGWFDK